MYGRVPAIDDVANNIRNNRQEVDRNPSISCGECDVSYNYQDYWESRYVEGKDWHPGAVHWICDDCLDEMYEEYRVYKRREKHKTLTEWEA